MDAALRSRIHPPCRDADHVEVIQTRRFLSADGRLGMLVSVMRQLSLWVPAVLTMAAVSPGSSAVPSTISTRSLELFANQPNDYDFGRQVVLPPSFGAAEFTLELMIRPDASYPVGPTSGGAGQLVNWSDADEQPYSSCCWWFQGNFLLDGHNNSAFENGTFSLQFYGGGRLRWLFGDGASAGPGVVRSVGAYPATATPSLLDGQWHRVALVRRWSGASGASLEMWIDGELVDSELTPTRANMRTWWDGWSGFPADQEGWLWGAEKQAAIGILSQYEDYKGRLDELRFFGRALSPVELASGGCAASPGPTGYYAIEEGTGTVTCDALGPSQCLTLIDMKPGFWSMDAAPACGLIFADGFES